MTEHEICEHIVKTGDCVNIDCRGFNLSGNVLNDGTECPLLDVCAGGEIVLLAQQWLEAEDLCTN